MIQRVCKQYTTQQKAVESFPKSLNQCVLLFVCTSVIHGHTENRRESPRAGELIARLGCILRRALSGRPPSRLAQICNARQQQQGRATPAKEFPNMAHLCGTPRQLQVSCDGQCGRARAPDELSRRACFISSEQARLRRACALAPIRRWI